MLLCKNKFKKSQRKLGKIETRKRVFWYADEDPPYTVTKASLPNLILELAGGKNIFQLPGEDTYVKVNWENVINNNPNVIILSESTWSPVEAQRRLFETNPAYSRLQAVQQKQFIIINYSYSTSIVSIADGVRTLASGLYPEKFKQ
ncbi:MAG: ABC transporter substrate-binding protein [Richelia sp. SM1_7_0]|nr:ABC transporter substrate-binding protein [Richelia sp. SM1_7_0]